MITGTHGNPANGPALSKQQLWMGVSVLMAALVLAATLAAGDLKYLLVSQDVVMSRLKDARLKNNDRVIALEKMFKEAGCQTTEQPAKGLHQPNVVCVLPGATASQIVVGGHLDHVEEGTGVIDDWSGASMLPSLYQSLASHPRQHTFVFIGFAGEEEGMVGSDFYAKHLTPEQRKQIAAMINLECLGVGPTEVWTTHSEIALVKMLLAVAQSLKLPLSGMNVEQVGTTDSESFAHYGIPRITIHSITPDTFAYLHTKKDSIDAIKPELYYDSYRMVTMYLALLEERLPTDGSPIDKPK